MESKNTQQPSSSDILSTTDDDTLGVLWGARAIGAYVGRSERPTFYLLERGLVPGTIEGWLALASIMVLRTVWST